MNLVGGEPTKVAERERFQLVVGKEHYKDNIGNDYFSNSGTNLCLG